VLADALLDSGCYPHPAQAVERIETHISWVFLAGDFAYKVKKPLDLGFLDFGTLAARKACCEEELRLNRRTAPGIYLEVVPIAGSVGAPRVGGPGEVLEYAVKMRRFEQQALASRVAAEGGFNDADSDALAALVAEFHASIPSAPADSAFGEPSHVAAPALQNFEQLDAMEAARGEVARRAALREWTQDSFRVLEPVMAARRHDGFVRECHGDLHLGNIAILEGLPVPFDCIEFNPELRWIDVMNEAAFLFMDLADRGLPAAAWRFLNGYLERTGDYAGLRVLRFYVVYRAIVRAKVACIRGAQPGLDEAARVAIAREYGEYLGLAERFARTGEPAIVLMHGLSGSGKSTIAQAMAARIGAVRVRSDVERKRLHGLEPGVRTGSGQDAGIYSGAASRATYDRLEAVAGDVIASGFPVIIDAAFLRLEDRARFRGLAESLGVPFWIVDCAAPEVVLRERILQREAQGADPSEAGIGVLEMQIATQEPLDAEERGRVLAGDVPALPREAA